MFFPTTAAIITSVGIVGFVLSSLFHASMAGEVFFNAASACMIVGPLVFFVYVMTGLCVEFVVTNQKPAASVTRGPSPYISAALVSHVAFHEWIPERLRRMGPLNPGGLANRI
jgi:hypothetical protein